jgi:hypothetical protein
MARSIRREDPAYLAAMREAKELFDAEMAKSAMKSRGRTANAAAKAPVVVVAEPTALEADAALDEIIDDVKAAEVVAKPAAAPAPARRRTRRPAAATV